MLGVDPDGFMVVYNRIFLSVAAANITIAIIVGVLIYFGKSPVSIDLLLITIWTTSFLFLISGLVRIQRTLRS
jgi:hypothetical protein